MIMVAGQNWNGRELSRDAKSYDASALDEKQGQTMSSLREINQPIFVCITILGRRKAAMLVPHRRPRRLFHSRAG
jgi:hypothetical protein